jgi:Alpha/beta hydrolase of unknown function (DUF1400)
MMIFFSCPKFNFSTRTIYGERSKLNKNRFYSRLLKKLAIVFSHFAIGASIPIFLAQPARSAEKIYVNYGLLEFSLTTDALEEYARTGKINNELGFFANYLTKEQLEQLRQTLITPVDLNPVAVSQFFYSPQGEVILRRVGQVIQTTRHQSGFYALRSALILAATKKEGLTLLNVLKIFPSYALRINSDNGLAIIGELDNLFQITQNTVSIVKQQADREIQKSPSIDFSKLPDLRKAFYSSQFRT